MRHWQMRRRDKVFLRIFKNFCILKRPENKVELRRDILVGLISCWLLRLAMYTGVPRHYRSTIAPLMIVWSFGDCFTRCETDRCNQNDFVDRPLYWRERKSRTKNGDEKLAQTYAHCPCKERVIFVLLCIGFLNLRCSSTAGHFCRIYDDVTKFFFMGVFFYSRGPDKVPIICLWVRFRSSPDI